MANYVFALSKLLQDLCMLIHAVRLMAAVAASSAFDLASHPACTNITVLCWAHLKCD